MSVLDQSVARTGEPRGNSMEFGGLRDDKDSLLCALRMILELGASGMGWAEDGFDTRTWDDLSMAALTVESMPINFGRRVSGIWRSS
jgi:hypothetical protein